MVDQEETPTENQRSVERDATDPHAFLIHYLAQHEAKCPICRYNLKNLTSPVCPECGADLELRVGAADTTHAPWIVLLLAMSIPAGVGVLVWCGCILSEGQIFRIVEEGPQGVIGLILMLYTVACQVAVVFVVSMRMRFLRLPKTAQGMISGFAVFLTGVVFFVFFVLVGAEI